MALAARLIAPDRAATVPVAAPARPPLHETRRLSNGCTIRIGTRLDAPAMHALITDSLEPGHLLPRTFGNVETYAARFSVIEREGRVIGCAELAPLQAQRDSHAGRRTAVAEVRSLVIDRAERGQGLGTALVEALSTRARHEGFSTLCAFTHHPAHFIRLGFSIVPHVWLPEKIAHDCTRCAKFRTCGQYAVVLRLAARGAAASRNAGSPRSRVLWPTGTNGARPLRMARAVAKVTSR